MREKLKEARKKAGMTQQQLAEYLKITLRSYQRLESGEFLGKIAHWDALEDLFKIHQRELRSETENPLQESEHIDSYESLQK